MHRLSPSCPPCGDLQHSKNHQEQSNNRQMTTNRHDERTNNGELDAMMTSVNHGNQSALLLQQPFPPTLQKTMIGMGRVQRDEFARMFDVGVPLMPSSEGNEEVLILYSDESSLPYNSAASSSNSGIPRLMSSPEDATKNCLTMNMILLEPERTNHCIAMMGQWPSHVVYPWMRVVEGQQKKAAASFEHPLRMVSRSRQISSEGLDFPSPKRDFMSFYTHLGFTSLQNYLNRMGKTLQNLKPLAESCSSSSISGFMKNTVIVMLCSFGQSELFLNFVCSARARGLDTSQVLLFAADLPTKELAESMGIATFYDEEAFLNLKPSKRFGDAPFKQMMLAKVYCLHLISQLEHDILFQDVDMIWYKHPLEYFVKLENVIRTMGNFDMYFQDDGSRWYRHEPYHGNGGFFYIRYNERTAYMLSNLVRQGDFILKKNEQTVINLLLNEHASLTGLRVKTLNREDSDFIGGWHYHHRPALMKRVIKGNVTPYIFHMSWTDNKKVKHDFLEQMGYLFVSERCIGKTASEILQNHSIPELDRENLLSACCVSDPVARCHYSDKPSKFPCHGSPSIGTENVSFW